MENFLNFYETEKVFNLIIAGKLDVYNGEIFGIGYYFLDSKYSCIDLDNCFHDNTTILRQSYKKLMGQCKDTYIEYSASGRGLHILIENDIKLDKFEFKFKFLKDAYVKAGIDIDKDLKTDGKPPGLDYLCDKKFVALTGNLYSETTNINYNNSQFKGLYMSFKKYYKNDNIKVIEFKKEAKKEAKKVKVNQTEYNRTNGIYVTDYFSYIKDRINLADVIGYYADSRLTDGNHWNCPIHGGKSRSFRMFSPDKYVCYSPNCRGNFGSNGYFTGDLFDFVKNVNNLRDNREVAEILNLDFNLNLIFNWSKDFCIH